ncbi:SPOR domain-containing protein [Sulfurihydrogenibium subterraneum]|uniref:SPOR domain-containing protein n=1 Tax=Sulfurihydrogenibium subterraneum TaxID=171121 RepID=UPI00048E5B5A|nr:SPOR domain-containing protein [Sulfurihydrogenibium subterraneum]
MEDRDLKSAVKQIKQKKKKETLERLIIFLSGLLITLVFIAIGLNFYSKSNQTVSEPQVKIASEAVKPTTPPQPQSLQTTPPVEQQQNKPTETNQVQPSQEKQQVETQPPQPKQETAEKLSQKEVKEPVKQEPKDQSKAVQKVEKETKKENKENVKQESKPSNKPVENIEKQPKKEEKQTVAMKQENQVKSPSKKEDSTAKEIIEKIKSGYFSIQVGAFSTREKAEIEKVKYPNAYIIEEGGLHKVLVGKFQTEKEARDYQKESGIKGFIKRLGS